jgi:hypothetical protein
MDKLSELLKDFYKHFAGLGIYIIPGVVVMETIFDIGFFGHRITNAYDLAFYILCGLIFGLPFHFSQPEQLNEVFLKFKKKKNDATESFWEGLSDELELGFCFY